MNLIDYNQAVEALEKERKLLLNREQYGAENVLVHYALNVIAELPIIRQPAIVRCKECKYYHKPEYGFTYGDCTYCYAWRQVKEDDYCSKGEEKHDG